MRRSACIIAILAIPALLLFDSCKKEKVIKTPATPQAPVKVALGDKAIDIQFDYNGDLYILASDKIQVLTNGKLTTLSLPATALSDFIYYDDINHGPAQHIAADSKGTIILARKDGIRIIYKDGRVETYIQGDIGWKVEGLEDLAVAQTNEVVYSSLTEGLVKLDNSFADRFSGIYPYQFDTYAFKLEPPIIAIHAIDTSPNNIFWLGSNKGIVRAETSEHEIVKANIIGAAAGAKAEGPVDQVKMTNVTQLEATDDGSIICFIDQGILKQIRNNAVKIIMPMPDDTRIALSKDAKKLYFLEKGDLKVIELGN